MITVRPGSNLDKSRLTEPISHYFNPTYGYINGSAGIALVNVALLVALLTIYASHTHCWVNVFCWNVDVT